MRTLKEIRDEAKLSLEEAIRRIRQIEPTAPKSYMGLYHIENRGTDRIFLIRAMASVYGARESEVEAAALKLFTERVKKCSESLDSSLHNM